MGWVPQQALFCVVQCDVVVQPEHTTGTGLPAPGGLCQKGNKGNEASAPGLDNGHCMQMQFKAEKNCKLIFQLGLTDQTILSLSMLRIMHFA